MKECTECGNKVEDLVHVCPKCGSESFIGSYSVEDALSALDTMKHQGEAAQHVDKSAKLFMEGRLDEAKKELEIALKLNPMNPTAHGNMGFTLLKQGKAKEAISWLEKALQLNPNLEGIPQALSEAKSAAKSDDSECFIATACYNDSECEEIMMLREFRDSVILRVTFLLLTFIAVLLIGNTLLEYWSDLQKPSYVLLKMKRLQSEGKYEDIKEYYTSGTVKAMEEVDKLTPDNNKILSGDKKIMEGPKYKIISEKIIGNTAKVSVQYLEHPVKNMIGLVVAFKMKKEDGDWKIDLEDEMNKCLKLFKQQGNK